MKDLYKKNHWLIQLRKKTPAFLSHKTEAFHPRVSYFKIGFAEREQLLQFFKHFDDDKGLFQANLYQEVQTLFRNHNPPWPYALEHNSIQNSCDHMLFLNVMTGIS